ncbi:MAG: VTT domain-containing protein [Polyangiales bacterium]
MRRPSLKSVLWAVVALAVLVTAVLLWQRYVPARWTSAEHLGQLLRRWNTHPLGPLYACGVYALLASAFVPVTALITATALVFDPPHAFAYAMAGSLLSAALSCGVGRVVSGPVLRRMSGPRLQRFRERLHTHTFSATVAARILPVGNFSAINLLAGALAVPFWQFMLGNVVGMVFGIAALTLLTGRIVTTLASPTPGNIAIIAGLLVAVIAISIALARFVTRRQARQD